MSGPFSVAIIRYTVRTMLLANAKLPSANTAVRAIFFDRASCSAHTIGIGIHRSIRSPMMLSTALPMKKSLALIQRAPTTVLSQAAWTGIHPKMDTKIVARNQHTTNMPTR